MLKALEQIFFPRFCINCNKEGSFLCEDCFFLIEVMERVYCLCDYPKAGKEKCKECSSKSLDALHFASHLQGPLAEKLYKSYTKEPFLRDLSYPLSGLIIMHFLSLKRIPQKFFLHPLPVENKKTAGYDTNKEVADKIEKPLGLKGGKKALLFSVLYDEEMEKEAEKLKRKGVKEVRGVCVFRR